MENKMNALIAVAIVQALSLLWLAWQRLPEAPRSAYAAEAQEVVVTGHRISRYEPVPVQVKNDDAIKVRCVD
jgi:hypothetical protein